MPRLGKISVGTIWREEKTANRGEWIGTLQIAFTRKPAQGDHVGSRRHSYQSRLCSQLMTFAPHARPSVHDPSNLGSLLFLLKLCFIEILFGVSLLVTSSLSCLGAKMWSLFSRTRLFEFVLLASPPIVVSKLTSLPPAPDQLSLGFYKVESKLLPIFWPSPLRLLLTRFQFFFFRLFNGGQSLWLCFKMISFWDKTHLLWVFLSGYRNRGQK